MTSEGLSTCYVYITLPGKTEQVTAGRFVLETDRHGAPVGRFVYGRSYLARPDAVPVDPVELRLSERAYATAALGGVFGALRDASPDHWGRRLIARHLGREQPSELDFLLHSPDDRAGALGFGLSQTPPGPKRLFNQTLQLTELQSIADALIADEDAPAGAPVQQVENLLLLGTSMGGARPKAVVEDASGLWVAKFNRKDDAWNNARVEHTMLQLARACGLDAAESRIETAGGRDVLLVKRFDRARAEGGYLRARMVSALTLLRAEDTYRSRDRWSYVLLAEEVRRACAEPAQDAAELFRRMCFNALISNTDDHPRNHAILARGTGWMLSPAYDLTPAVPISQERRDLAMSCGDLGRFANGQNLLSQAARFLLAAEEAQSIVDRMARQVGSDWYRQARSAGVSDRDCERIAGAFVYPGFGAAASTQA